jgi:hypothetical protein
LSKDQLSGKPNVELPQVFYIYEWQYKTIVENVVFKKPTIAPYTSQPWVLEVSSTTFDFDTYDTADETAASYQGYFSLITVGNSLAKGYKELLGKFHAHKHEVGEEWSSPISHAHLEKLNPPAVADTEHTGRYPTDAPLWYRSRWAGDDHVSLLSRLGSKGDNLRDVNDNAMLGDLLLASSTASGGNFLNTTADSRKLVFHTQAGSPVQLYAPSGGSKLVVANANLGIANTNPAEKLSTGSIQ